MAELRRIQGKVAVVTGAGHGLGRGAHRLSEEGASVVVAELDASAGERVSAELTSNGVDAIAVATDVGDETSVADLMKSASSHFGHVDILINNAAISNKTVSYETGGLEQITVADFERVLRVNVIGTWLCIKYAAPLMRKAGYGKIVNISSTMALRPPPGRRTGMSYPTSKAGVIAITREAAGELGPDGIRVNAVLPGYTLSDDVISEESIELAGKAAEAVERPLRQPAVPEDLVGTVAFFASPDSDFITGQILVVDGGAVMY